MMAPGLTYKLDLLGLTQFAKQLASCVPDFPGKVKI
jgi:hypothetical protein